MRSAGAEWGRGQRDAPTPPAGQQRRPESDCIQNEGERQRYTGQGGSPEPATPWPERQKAGTGNARAAGGTTRAGGCKIQNFRGWARARAGNTGTRHPYPVGQFIYDEVRWRAVACADAGSRTRANCWRSVGLIRRGGGGGGRSLSALRPRPAGLRSQMSLPHSPTRTRRRVVVRRGPNQNQHTTRIWPGRAPRHAPRHAPRPPGPADVKTF